MAAVMCFIRSMYILNVYMFTYVFLAKLKYTHGAALAADVHCPRYEVLEPHLQHVPEAQPHQWVPHGPLVM